MVLSTPLAPSSKGEDHFWLLRSVRGDAIDDAELGRVIEVVNAEKVGIVRLLSLSIPYYLANTAAGRVPPKPAAGPLCR